MNAIRTHGIEPTRLRAVVFGSLSHQRLRCLPGLAREGASGQGLRRRESARRSAGRIGTARDCDGARYRAGCRPTAGYSLIWEGRCERQRKPRCRTRFRTVPTRARHFAFGVVGSRWSPLEGSHGRLLRQTLAEWSSRTDHEAQLCPWLKSHAGELGFTRLEGGASTRVSNQSPVTVDTKGWLFWEFSPARGL